MQTNSRILDDLAKVAGGAASTLTGVKEEVEGLARQRLEKLLGSMDLVTREEFDAVRAMAAKARAEQESMALRLAALEDRLAELEKQPKKAAPKEAAPKKSAPKTAT
ncbi:MAG: accessory factor UbiK family protein [Magnetovibrionaceae bacterium]